MALNPCEKFAQHLTDELEEWMVQLGVQYLRFSLTVLLLDQIPKGVYYVDELLLSTNNHYANI
ncbi:hypothetical protein Q8G35_25925 [Peribacillus simplex]|uniref:Uncharacterized protein n=2 Tax=Peribacillus TaxID=2675229 RepID=A0AA90SMG4_9BACI|nr:MULTISPECIES: hypothetical protein [Peribacillus]MDP1421709.1 hypothetical protein [Peribacillus simplex]MDP1454406.1 hypothetical protein [Peribacillus frigoritolerans]